ncbi:MAG: autoinducer binding domain-containing protein, partial [Sideroxydans sp.]
MLAVSSQQSAVSSQQSAVSNQPKLNRMELLLERFGGLLECTSEKTWQQTLFQFGKEYGFEHTLFGLTSQRPTSLNGSYICGNFSAQWLDVYEQKQFIRIDPRVTHCANRFVPLLWEPAIFTTVQQKEMYEEASAYGLCSGIALPMHAANGKFGMLYFATQSKLSARVQNEILNALPALSMLRDFALESSMRFSVQPAQEKAPNVTPRELECLKWCAAGKNTKEIALLTR